MEYGTRRKERISVYHDNSSKHGSRLRSPSSLLGVLGTRQRRVGTHRQRLRHSRSRTRYHFGRIFRSMVRKQEPEAICHLTTRLQVRSLQASGAGIRSSGDDSKRQRSSRFSSKGFLAVAYRCTLASRRRRSIASKEARNRAENTASAAIQP